jgi:Ser/Thr protein kinase RdoA (MazF antagonist)
MEGYFLIMTLHAPVLQRVLQFFELPPSLSVAPFGTGLINHTWLLSDMSEPRYVLQEINANVFKQPRVIDDNLRAIAKVFAHNHAEYLFTYPLQNHDGATMFVDTAASRYWRIYAYVPCSMSVDRVTDAAMAYEAARQFGEFDARLSDVPIQHIRPSIPRFHDLDLRWQQFNDSLARGNRARIGECSDLIARLQAYAPIEASVRAARGSGMLRERLMHHDTKISNVLFEQDTKKGLCVVDLDTVMSGIYLSDVGDMMRTYLCPFDENHTTPDDLFARREVYAAIREGYLSQMGTTLTRDERDQFDLAGKFMIFMQALRFATDYFNDDMYYGARYALHNYDRALNQLTLLDRYCALVD